MTTSPPTPAAPSAFTQFLQSIFAGVRQGLAIEEIPPVVVFLENTKGLNPTALPDQLKYAAQLDLLRTTLAANLTTLLPAEILSLNAVISNELQAVLEKALTNATTPAAVPAPA
jgi:hypothetical protein